MKHLLALTFHWHAGNEMNHTGTAIDTSRTTHVYSPTFGAQVITFLKSNLIPSEVKLSASTETAIIINLRKNPTSLSNHHHHQPKEKPHFILKAHL